MALARFSRSLPSWQSLLLAVLSALLLVLAFPDFEYWILAWAGFVPLLLAIEREKASPFRSFLTGWVFGTTFFLGTCWWLTYSMIRYGLLPPLVAYILLFIICLIVGAFPALFASLLSIIVKRFGSLGFLAAPFVWIATELLRYWVSGNNWNAIAYSQSFGGWGLGLASIGGVYLTGFTILAFQSAAFAGYRVRFPVQFGSQRSIDERSPISALPASIVGVFCVVVLAVLVLFGSKTPTRAKTEGTPVAEIATIQPNVPMSGLDYDLWMQLRKRHVELAEAALDKLKKDSPASSSLPTTVIFPESPMNFMYEDDEEFRSFVRAFNSTHNVNLLFNSAEPNREENKYFNSAVLTDKQGNEIAQYDKIHLVPFGEAVPAPFEGFVPALVGSFSYGNRYELMPFGEAKAGVVLCYESAFGDLSREMVRRGADVLIEMTNDGYLGPTPVLRQHLAHAVFRAVETNRPLVRTTNVGISGYINEQGEVSDITRPYTEDIRVWPVLKSDGSQTFYVKYGDWFAWSCTILTIALLGFVLANKRSRIPEVN